MAWFSTSARDLQANALRTLLATAVLLTSASVYAADIFPPAKLRHEPVQPLSAPKHLNPLKVNLGEQLFHEVRLSGGNNIACISCHNLNSNGADKQRYSLGRDGRKLDTNTLTIFNSSLNHYQFWDGRARNLGEQINFVVASEAEFATSWPTIVGKLKQDTFYTQAFKKIYKNGITADNIRDALVTFERSLITTNSRFDRYLLGDTDAISSTEKAGYQLFKAYGCVACHQGQNVGGNLFMKFGVFGDYFAARGNPTRADLGRFNVTGEERHRHVFRVPSLRLAALTPPYFHDGSVDTLEQAVKVMAKHQLGRKIPAEDIDRIVAFIKTLPGDYQGHPLKGVSPAQNQADAP